VLVNQIKSLITANKDADLILISPYITKKPLVALCSLVNECRHITIYSRHDIDVFEQKSSSLSAFYYAHSKLNISIYSVDVLHAKAYIAGRCALIGSANLTDRGLGFSPASNLEILVDAYSGSDEVQVLLKRVVNSAYPVSYLATRAIDDELVDREGSRINSLKEKVSDLLRRDAWLPSADLEYLAYYFISGSRYGIPSVLRKSIDIDARYLEGLYGAKLESIDATSFYRFVSAIELVELFLEARVFTITAVREVLPGEFNIEFAERLCQWLDFLVVGARH
jgi:hypothetical protein